VEMADRIGEVGRDLPVVSPRADNDNTI